MTNKEDIQKELKEIAPLLAQGQNKDRAYQVPENYFTDLSGKNILAVAKEKEAKVYDVPQDYFADLQNKVVARIDEDMVLSQSKKRKSGIIRNIRMLSGIAASLILLIYVSTNYTDLSSTPDYTYTEIESYIEQNIDKLELEELLALEEAEEWEEGADEYEEDIIDDYIEQNIYTLEEEFLSELIE